MRPYYPYPEDLMEHDWHDLLARRHENIIIIIIIPIIINSKKIQYSIHVVSAQDSFRYPTCVW